MNIKQAKQEIKHTVQAYLKKTPSGDYCIPAIRQRPLLLIGAPGIGKTQIMEQIARECRIGLVAYTITHHTRQSAVGLPFIREEEFDGKTCSVTEYTMSEIIASVYEKMRDTGLKEGILFIDEINCVSETLAPTMLQFLQCKTFGNQKVPEGWIIVAAGNPPEYNKSVREFDMVTLDRVRCMNVEADYRVWKEYARERHLNSAVLSYLELKPNRFYKVEADVEGLQFVTARGWEDLSNLMDVYEQLEIPVTEEVVGEFLHHKDVAEDAAAYFELYRKYQDDYGIADILAGKVRSSVYARIRQAAFDERVSVVNLLLHGLFRVFREYDLEKFRTDTWFTFLKEFRTRVQSAEHAQECYDALIAEEEYLLLQKKQGELLTKEEICRREWLIGVWKQAGSALRTLAPDAGPKEAFTAVREAFEEQREKLEDTEARLLDAVENAFDFMENAFESGQEMVIFVTELTITPEAALFFAEHEVERYDLYKQQLLIGTRRAELLSEMRRE